MPGTIAESLQAPARWSPTHLNLECENHVSVKWSKRSTQVDSVFGV